MLREGCNGSAAVELDTRHAGLERLLDDARPALHELARGRAALVGQQVGDPHEARPSVAVVENLRGGVVVRVRTVDDRPDETAFLVVEVDEYLAGPPLR